MNERPPIPPPWPPDPGARPPVAGPLQTFGAEPVFYGRRPAISAPARPWRFVILFILTFITTTLTGAEHYGGFLLDFVQRPLAVTSTRDLMLGGLWYSLSILAILGAHEMGHYLACRYYRVDASLPYFLPFPGGLTGTLGAFIRIRSAIRTKPMLFDIGVAGPIAGFVVAIPVMTVGLAMSRVAKLPANFVGLELGEPLVFKALSWMLWGPIPQGSSLNLHPMAFAAWFGLLATALNLFPIGQLDGGHISYAVLGRRSTWVTLGAIGTAVVLTFNSLSWLVWTILMLGLLAVFGFAHPPTVDDEIPLDRTRRWIALFALLMFVACFTPAPIQPYELVRPR